MKQLADVSKKMIIVICVLLLIATVAGIAFFRSFEAIPFALGAMLGAALCVYKVISLDRMVVAAQKKDPLDVNKSVHVQYFLRFILTAGVLLIGFFVPFINHWGVVVGLFFLPISAYATNFLKTKD